MSNENKIQMMRNDVAQVKNEINQMVKLIPSILKANGIEGFDIFNMNCPIGTMELIGSTLRLMNMSDELIRHWIDAVEETDKKLTRIEERIDTLERRNEAQFERVLESLRELKELYNDRQLPAVKQ